jgi:UDP-N-acetylglucosamine 4-epimerase
MSAYEQTRQELVSNPKKWVVTGAAGFIGSHLVETLLELNQEVVGLDNLATVNRRNLEQVRRLAKAEHWKRFTFLEGNIRELAACQRACEGADFVLHQAALGSVPASIDDPARTNENNVSGFLNMLVAARDQRVRRFIYASSSSVYGDDPSPLKTEERLGRPLSPYAVSKLVNELYAGVWALNYGLESIGLRYFNVFGPRQNPEGPYAAVIPRWIEALLRNQPVQINGDGSTSRDFCYVANAVQANLLAAATTRSEALNRVFNVAVNLRTTLNELFGLLQEKLGRRHAHAQKCRPVYGPFRKGDVLHSQADISRARELLGYAPTHTVSEGLDAALEWFCKKGAG